MKSSDHPEDAPADPGRSILLIGYGNTLRGDDAAGPAAAEIAAGWRLPHLVARPCQQLTPDLAEDVGRADVVIFIDALAQTIAPAGLRIERMDPAPARVRGDSHVACPCELLRLARELYDARPEAWIIGIPAEQFDCGAGLSRSAQDHIDRALEHVRRMAVRSSAGLPANGEPACQAAPRCATRSTDEASRPPAGDVP